MTGFFRSFGTICVALLGLTCVESRVAAQFGNTRTQRSSTASAKAARTRPLAAKAARAENIGPPPAAKAPKSPDVASEAVLAAAIQGLLAERAYWLDQTSSVVLPITLVSAGVVGVGVAVGLMSAYASSGHLERVSEANYVREDYVSQPKSSGLRLGAMITGIAGGALITSGAALLFFRPSSNEQTQQLERIDGRLRVLGWQVHVTPWFTAPVAQLTSTSGGVRMDLRF